MADLLLLWVCRPLWSVWEQSLQRIVPVEVGDPMSQRFTISEPSSCSFASFRPIYINRKVAPFTVVHDYDKASQLTLHGEVPSWPPPPRQPSL